jgi:hypothetical protein
MCQLEYIQIFYAFHFDALPKNEHEHEHGSYHVPWNSRNIEMTISLVQAGGGVLWRKSRLPFSCEIASVR